MPFSCWSNKRVVDEFVCNLDRLDQEDPVLEAAVIFDPYREFGPMLDDEEFDNIDV